MGQQDVSSKSINAQMERWIVILDQWEQAIETGLEVIVTGDIHISHLDRSFSSFSMQSSQTVGLCLLVTDSLFQRIFPFHNYNLQ